MKNFFRKIGQTFYSSDLYGEARDRSTGNGLKFLLKVILLLSVVFGVVASVAYLVVAPKMEQQLVSYIQSTYPDDLVVSIKDKTLYTNKTEPVFFPMAETLKQKGPLVKKHILVLAPNETVADINLLTTYDTYMVVTSKAILAQNKDSEFRTYVLNYENIDISKLQVNEFALKLFKTVMPIVLIFSIPTGLFILGAVVVKYLVMMFLVCLLVYGIFKTQKINMTYKQIYRMGVYTIVPLLLINILFFPLYVGSSLVDILLVVAILLYVNKDRREENLALNEEEKVSPENTTEPKI